VIDKRLKYAAVAVEVAAAAAVKKTKSKCVGQQKNHIA
jgi:predicted YcjX-like family ATPase